MLDLDSLPNLPEPKDIILFCKCCHELPGKLEYIAKQHLSCSKDHLLEVIAKVEAMLGVSGQAISREKGKGAWAGPELSNVLSRLEAALEHYSHTFARGNIPIRVRLAMPHILCNRLGPLLQKGLSEELRGSLFTFFRDYHALAQPVPATSDFDLLLTFAESDFHFGSEADVKCVKLRRCLLCSNNTIATDLSEGVRFSWELLKGYEIVRHADPHALPNPPYDKLEVCKPYKEIWAGSYGIAHNEVRNRPKAATVTHPVLLLEHEEKYTDAVCLPEVEIGVTHLYLVRPKRAHETTEHKDRVDSFEKHIWRYIAGEIPQLLGRSEQLSKKLGGRWIVHFTRGDPPTDGRNNWAKGTLSLRVTPTGYIKGQHKLPSGEAFELFGRFSHRNANEYHLIWRGTQKGTDEEHYSASFVASDQELQRGPLIGTWQGRRTKAGPFEAAIGAMCLCRKDDLSNSHLDNLLQKHVDASLTFCLNQSNTQESRRQKPTSKSAGPARAARKG